MCFIGTSCLGFKVRVYPICFFCVESGTNRANCIESTVMRSGYVVQLYVVCRNAAYRPVAAFPAVLATAKHNGHMARCPGRRRYRQRSHVDAREQ